MEFINQYGQVNIKQQSNIIICSFSGSLNERLVDSYTAGLCSLIKNFHGKPWSYICNAKMVIAATPQAEKKLVMMTELARANNCIASAFIFASNLAINQMQRVLDKASSGQNITDILFSDLPTAIDYVSQALNANQQSNKILENTNNTYQAL
ncbi:MAG: hypothetical protein ACTJH9_14230 [Pseudoalteromonas sp.]|uniref:hypothetical protein n=1 Tax=unclassified Pseudoalteromonas TaxID=194690 RepID=UPI003F973A35